MKRVHKNGSIVCKNIVDVDQNLTKYPVDRKSKLHKNANNEWHNLYATNLFQI